MELYWILSVFAFVFGASIASFLNVVIWRVPRGESIVSPPSHCPKCNAAIRWYQNLPILSWLALRGRCASCHAPISPRYILIETLGGVLFLGAFSWCFWMGAPIWLVPVYWMWIALMIVGSFIDFDLQLLPDFVTVGGMALGLLTASVESFLLRNFVPLAWSAGGLAFGFALLWLVRFLGTKAFRREAMGMGDVFLMGAVGAMCGPLGALATLILSSVFGSLVGLAVMAISKTKLGSFVAIPYGPYICLGCLCWMFGSPWIVRWYFAVLT